MKGVVVAKEMIDYVDWAGIVRDYGLRTGDITPEGLRLLESVLVDFVKWNNGLCDE